MACHICSMILIKLVWKIKRSVSQTIYISFDLYFLTGLLLSRVAENCEKSAQMSSERYEIRRTIEHQELQQISSMQRGTTGIPLC